MSVHAVIAVRGGPTAKSRCADALDGAQRAHLVHVMVDDMLGALGSADFIDAIHVVTPTRAIADLALSHGARPLIESEATGLNTAFDSARRLILRDAPDARIVFLPGDLPDLDIAELARMLIAHTPGKLVIAPSNGGGTGALLASASEAIELCFGPDSAAAHRDAAEQAGLTAIVIDAPGLAFDIDSPADLDLALRQGHGPRTRAYLKQLRCSETLSWQ